LTICDFRLSIVAALSVTLCLFAPQFLAGQSKSDVESILDHWETRKKAHSDLDNLGEAGHQLLAAVATDVRQPYPRRWHAIQLLGTYKDPVVSHALIQLLDDDKLIYRTYAIYGLMELKDRDAIPALIHKLDDHSVCLQETETDPVRTIDIYCSDEAVRALEEITGLSFEKEKDLWIIGHRATKPWKDWWAKQQADERKAAAKQ
jgi:HEAT repeat protein